MQTDKSSLETLKDIRSAIKEIDRLRVNRNLSEDEKCDLELSAVALRNA